MDSATFGSYQLGELLGRGSMGAVHVAQDVRLQRRVAVKVIEPALAMNERFRQRFLLESQMAASLEHPHIVPIYAAGEHDGSLFLAMRLIEGTDLGDILAARHHLPPSRAIALLGQAAQALDAAHAIGLVHRDVKPANLLVASGPPEHLYLCDFGLAKHASSVDSLTGERSFVGTITYIAPEQIESARVDGRADQYALACVLYECLTGVRPYERESELQTLFAHLREDPPRVTDAEPGLGTEIDEVIARALDKDPDARYPSCSAFIASAAQALGQSPQTVAPPAAAAAPHSLAAPPAATPPTRDGASPGRPRPSRRTAVRVGAAALAAVAAVVVIATRPDAGDTRRLAVGQLGILDPSGGRVDAAMNPGTSEVRALVHDGARLWAFSGASGFFLQRIDAARREVTQQVPLDREPYWLAPRAAFGAIWMTWNDAEGNPQLIRFDTQFGRITARVDLPIAKDAPNRRAEGVAVTGDAVWVAYGVPKRLARVDPVTNRVRRVVRLPGGQLWEDTLLAAGEGRLWAIDRSGRRIARLDDRTGELIARGKIHDGFVEDAAVAAGALWLAVEDDAGVWELDDQGSVAGKLATGRVPSALAVAGSSLYVANAGAGTVTRIDAATRSTRSFAVGHRPLALALARGKLWTFVGQSAADARARTTGARVLQGAIPSDPFTTDPAKLVGPESHALQYAVGVRLMDVRVAADGTSSLVPAGAAAPPVVSNGGRTYTFVVRPGLRFSPPSGASVTAQVWRETIERALSPVYGDRQTSYCQYVLPDIAGDDAYLAQRSAHLSGIHVRGSRISFTLTRPMPTLPARLANACFSAVPAGTPVVEEGIAQPIASAGPYYVDAHVPSELLALRRNPNYRGPRAGKLDGVVLQLGTAPAQAAAQVLRGAADYTSFGSAGAPASMLPGGRDAGRVLRPPASVLRSLILNTTSGPLRDVRVRRAIALAVDRRAVAGVDGGRPAAHLIAPGVPGYAPTQTIPPASPAAARKLLGGRRVTLALATFPGTGHANEERARLVRASLARADIGVTVRLTADPWGEARRGRPRIDMLLDGWVPDYADPDGTIGELLDPDRGGSGLYPAWFTDRGWLARLRSAARVTGPARAARFAALDSGLERGPLPIVPLSYTAGTPQLVSARIGCRVPLPQFNGLLDLAALCLRHAG